MSLMEADGSGKGKLRVNPMFGDGMVLQRDAAVPVWGTAERGQTIVVECGGLRAETVAADGRWKATLPPSPAGGPWELTVRTGRESRTFRDVWYGDVWLAGGQSNMAWPLKDDAEAAAELPLADWPELRYCEIPKIAYEEENEIEAAGGDTSLDHAAATDGSAESDNANETAAARANETGPAPTAPSWVACRPETAGEFSAVAYYFARRLRRDVDVPIGLIGCNFGATSASCWMPEERLAADPELRVYLDEYVEQVRDFDWEAHERAEKRFQDDFAAYQAREKAGATGDELGVLPWPPPMSPRSFMRPCGLYGTMLRKAAPYALKGFLYYQGEGDAHRPRLYDRLLEALIAQWRADWEDETLPFLFVQLPAFGFEGDPDGDAWALLRESQAQVAERVPGAAMAVALDCGERDDIHPAAKRPVGERLARAALRGVYGRDIIASGPVCEEVRFEEGRAVLRFACAGALAARGGGNAPAGFELAGEDGVYVPAAVAADGDRIVLDSPQVVNPRGVRYAWANYTEADLTDDSGLPAAPFRYPREDAAAGDVAKL